MHNGYGSADGAKLEDDVQNALEQAGITFEKSQKIGPNGSLGEIDFQTDKWIIEATVRPNGKLSQIQKYLTKIFNPDKKSVVLIGPNYVNKAAVKAIEDTGAKVANSIEDLINIIK